ncbi:hypothetical protein DCC78_04470 [bacterium]|nr:MAG: hypothetical protein DCC78_04470 [bacterium]
MEEEGAERLEEGGHKAGIGDSLSGLPRPGEVDQLGPSHGRLPDRPQPHEHEQHGDSQPRHCRNGDCELSPLRGAARAAGFAHLAVPAPPSGRR